MSRIRLQDRDTAPRGPEGSRCLKEKGNGKGEEKLDSRKGEAKGSGKGKEKLDSCLKEKGNGKEEEKLDSRKGEAKAQEGDPGPWTDALKRRREEHERHEEFRTKWLRWHEARCAACGGLCKKG